MTNKFNYRAVMREKSSFNEVIEENAFNFRNILNKNKFEKLKILYDSYRVFDLLHGDDFDYTQTNKDFIKKNMFDNILKSGSDIRNIFNEAVRDLTPAEVRSTRAAAEAAEAAADEARENEFIRIRNEEAKRIEQEIKEEEEEKEAATLLRLKRAGGASVEELEDLKQTYKQKRDVLYLTPASLRSNDMNYAISQYKRRIKEVNEALADIKAETTALRLGQTEDEAMENLLLTKEGEQIEKDFIASQNEQFGRDESQLIAEESRGSKKKKKDEGDGDSEETEAPPPDNTDKGKANIMEFFENKTEAAELINLNKIRVKKSKKQLERQLVLNGRYLNAITIKLNLTDETNKKYKNLKSLQDGRKRAIKNIEEQLSKQ